MAVKRFAVSLPEKVAGDFEDILKQKDNSNRSKAITEAVIRFIKEEKKKKEFEIGVIILKGTNNWRTKARLDEIKNHYSHSLISSHREHGKENFADIWIAKGNLCLLHRIKSKIENAKGVINCTMPVIRADKVTYEKEVSKRNVLDEDLGSGDITTEAIVPKDERAKAVIIANEDGMYCGGNGVEALFGICDDEVVFKALKKDGDSIKKGDVVAKINGNAHSIMACERTALNILMALSGVATHTSRFVERIKSHKAILIDTREVFPDARDMIKYAVRCGGGTNGRQGLFDGIVVNKTHVMFAGSIKGAVRRARTSGKPVSVEVRNLKEVDEALKVKADRIIICSMSVEDTRKAVIMAKGKAETEATGAITLDNINEIAATGVDYISAGAVLTLTEKPLDFSFEITRVE